MHAALPYSFQSSIPDQMGVQKGGSYSPGGGGHTRNLSGGGISDAVTFEDRRKENFEAGRHELERRRRAIREQQEREAVREGGRGGK